MMTTTTVLLFGLVLVHPSHQAAQLQFNPLKGLRPLPKPHYSWPFPPGYLNNASTSYLDGFLHDYVRITGSCPVGLDSTTKIEVQTCAEVCAVSSPTAEQAKVCIAVNYSPWYAKFPGSDPTITGPTETAEMAYYTGLLANVTVWLATSPYASMVGVGAFLLDQEKFSASATTPVATVAALTRKCDLIYNASLAMAPAARVEWYNRGSVANSYTYGWVGPVGAANVDKQWSHFSGDELGESLSVSLYNIRFLPSMRETYTRTVNYAMQPKQGKNGAAGGGGGGGRSASSAAASSAAPSGGVTPWLALGCGDHLVATHNCSGDEKRYNEPCGKFDFAAAYDPVLSWQLGNEINNFTQYGNSENPSFTPARAFAPWNYTEVVCLYPSILDARATSTANGTSTSMVDHFVAYVRGATGLEGTRQ